MSDKLAQRLFKALQALPARTRNAFVLYRFESWPYSKIARHMEITEADVEKTIREAIYALDKARAEFMAQEQGKDG